MALFNNFNTDFYGMDRFKDIMEHGGNVDQETLRAFIEESVNSLADGVDGPMFKNFGNGLAAVVSFESGFDNNNEKILGDDGDAICVSVREVGSSPAVENWAVVGEPVTLTTDDEADNYKEASELIYAQIVDADPDEPNEEGTIRDETIFDSLPNMVEAFNTWKDNINNDGQIKVIDINLDKNVQLADGRTIPGIVFTLDTDITESDHDELDEYFTHFMPDEIMKWTGYTNKYSFDYLVAGHRQFAFIVY